MIYEVKVSLIDSKLEEILSINRRGYDPKEISFKDLNIDSLKEKYNVKFTYYVMGKEIPECQFHN